jgi:hypothetical protein
VALDLSGQGLLGSLPASLGQLGSSLAVLALADNPGLGGALPATWQLPRLLLLDLQVGGGRGAGTLWAAAMGELLTGTSHAAPLI